MDGEQVVYSWVISSGDSGIIALSCCHFACSNETYNVGYCAEVSGEEGVCPDNRGVNRVNNAWVAADKNLWVYYWTGPSRNVASINNFARVSNHR